MFEEHGDIRTFFDLISGRGMVFVTYVSDTPIAQQLAPYCALYQYDLRAAERARERLQGSEISGRPVRRCACRLSLCAYQVLDRCALLAPSG